MDKNQVKDIIDQSIESLIEELKQGKSDRLKNYLAFCSRFHKYSVSNTLLIYFQMPEATRVAGFKDWNKLGYKVNKGSKSIRILAPIKYKYIDVNGEKIFFDKMSEIQKADTKNHRIWLSFIPVSVFDISQCTNTNGSEIPEFFTPLGNSHKEQYFNLVSIIEGKGIKVIETEETRGAEGVSYGGKIEIKASNDYNNKMLTLIHEISHEILDQGEGNDRNKTTREIRECRAEAVSYIVGQYIGLDNPFASDYLLSWGNTPKEVKEHLEAILKASETIIGYIEESKNIINGAA